MNLDGHKLHYHTDRIVSWLKDKNSVFPVYMEITPVNSCNHQCMFCALYYNIKNKKTEFLKLDLMKKRLKEFNKLGIKSILYAGSGEPFLHKDIVELINITKQNTIDAAVNTNMVMYDKEKIRETLGKLSWMRASINAATGEKYAEIHKTNPDDRDTAIKNLEYAVKYKKEKKLKTVIGTQIVLVNDNMDEVISLAKKMRKTGVDYFTVKPFNPHPMSSNRCSADRITSKYLSGLEKKLRKLDNENFKTNLRMYSFNKIKNSERNYEKCYGLSFITFIDSSGQVYPCPAVFGNKEFSYGNIYKNNFKGIWLGSARKKIISKINRQFAKFKSTFCRPFCRLDNINSFLWDIKNPPDHVNFI